MKDSNIKSKKSSSDSENPVKNIIPEMPKDKRTKAVSYTHLTLPTTPYV